MNVKPGRMGPNSAGGAATADPRDIALGFMLSALDHLDSDAGISPVVGSQLQLAIDRLVSSMPSTGERLIAPGKQGGAS